MSRWVPAYQECTQEALGQSWVAMCASYSKLCVCAAAAALQQWMPSMPSLPSAASGSSLYGLGSMGSGNLNSLSEALAPGGTRFHTVHGGRQAYK